MTAIRRLRLAGLALAFLFAAAPAGAQVEEVVSIAMTVRDADRSAGFLADVLDFVRVSEVEAKGPEHSRLVGVFGARVRIVRMRLGSEAIDLVEYLSPADGRPVPPDSRSHDGWFQHVAIVVSDMEAAYARLCEHDVAHVSPDPQRLPDWNPDAGGIEAFYFRDPDGHVLELIAFPEGKGDPRWHEPGDQLFLGIDHTAIAVDDTEASLAFYRDVLGLDVVGASENWGPEQERLNAVFGARLRITALRAPEGPGIELLEYLAPSDGRPMPRDTRTNDLWHWHTRLRVDAPDVLEDRLRGSAWVSPGFIDFHDSPLGFGRGLLLRDPDGHALLLTAP